MKSLLVIFLLLFAPPTHGESLPDCKGSFTSNWSNCYGEINFSNGHKYAGNFLNGKSHGLGAVRFADDTFYVGGFLDGKYDGKGKISLKDGRVFEGTFRDTTPNRKGNYSSGQGTFHSEEGWVYIGDFKNAKPNGSGTVSYPDGGGYEGKWKNGLENGYGIRRSQNGDKYVGEFKDGKYHGQGTLTSSVGGQKKITRGFWKTGTFQYSSNQTKVALLIGNSKYNHTMNLTNPSNDVELLKIKLQSIGFTVDTLLDANKSDMEEAILNFSDKASVSDISLLFYAGHSIEAKGLNYLLPIDANIKREAHLEIRSTRLNWILEQIKSTRVLSIILLDACRDNPFSDTMYNAQSRSTTSRGLAKVRINGNQFIGFSASPGQVASDGDGQNSPYIKALINHITSEIEIVMLFRRVKTEVQESTSGLQVPYVENNLGADPVFIYK